MSWFRHMRVEGEITRAFIHLIIVIMLVVLTSHFGGKLGFAQEQSREFELLNALSEELEVPITSLEILGERKLTLRYLDQAYPTAKILNRETGKIHEITIDSSGKKVDKDALHKKNRAVKKARYENFDPAFYEYLKSKKPNDIIEVAIWLNAPDDPLPSPTPEEYKIKGKALVELEMEFYAQQKKGRLAVLQEPIVKLLRALGAEIRDVNGLAPLITARLKKGQIQGLAKRPEIDTIYLSLVNSPLLDKSVPSITVPPVWNRSITGSNERIAIIEREGIDFFNPFLRGMNRLSTHCFGIDGYHATKVAEIAGSDHPLSRGVAYQSFLLGGEACSWADADLQSATTWAKDNGARIHNNSWRGTLAPDNDPTRPTSMSLFHESVSRDWRITVVDAAGNCQGNPSPWDRCTIGPPATASNVITVGAYDDKRTTSWNDDTMWPFSSYVGWGRKPEMVAPGVNITTSGSLSGSGTSFAAPHVAGAAALLMQRNSSLRNWPEAIKAILMTSAIHNIEGDSWISDFDGAGAISVDHADKVVQKETGANWDVWNLAGGPITLVKSFVVAKDKHLRAYAVWNSNPSDSSYPDITKDFELTLFDPDDQPITRDIGDGFSPILVSEVIKAPKQGTYRLEITSSTDGSSTNLALAWWVFDGGNTNVNDASGPTTSGPPLPGQGTQISNTLRPKISLNPASLTFTARQAGQVTAGQSITITNGGGGTFTWSASSNVPWLTFTSSTSGTAPSTLSVVANPSGLNPGTYTGTITIISSSSEVSNSPQSIPVTLTVESLAWLPAILHLLLN